MTKLGGTQSTHISAKALFTLHCMDLLIFAFSHNIKEY